MYKDNNDVAEAVWGNGAAVMEGLVVHIYAENIRQQWGGQTERVSLVRKRAEEVKEL